LSGNAIAFADGDIASKLGMLKYNLKIVSICSLLGRAAATISQVCEMVPLPSSKIFIFEQSSTLPLNRYEVVRDEEITTRQPSV